MKRLFFKILFIALLLSKINSQFESYYKPKDCQKCRCYRIKCSRIQNYVDECEDEYKETCDHPDDITDENGCNIACGCCLEGECYHWLHYYCIMFRSFEFFTAINFLAISAHFFCILKMISYFFIFKHKWTKTSFEEKKENAEDINEKKFFCTYNHFLYIQSNNRTFDKVPATYLPEITLLFEELNSLKKLAINNMVLILSFSLLYLAQFILHFIVTFIAPEKPKFYGQIC